MTTEHLKEIQANPAKEVLFLADTEIGSQPVSVHAERIAKLISDYKIPSTMAERKELKAFVQGTIDAYTWLLPQLSDKTFLAVNGLDPITAVKAANAAQYYIAWNKAIISKINQEMIIGGLIFGVSALALTGLLLSPLLIGPYIESKMNERAQR